MDFVAKHALNEGNITAVASEALSILSYLKLLLQVLVGLSSAFIPEAARVALNIRAPILLASLLPLVIRHLYTPSDYFALHRAVCIRVCNSFVLLISYFVSNAYIRKRISGTNDLVKFVSVNSKPEFPVFPGIPFVVLSSFSTAAVVGTLLCMATIYVNSSMYQTLESLSLLLLILLGAFLSIPLILPSLPFEAMIKASMRSLCEVFRPTHVIVSCFLICIDLTLPISLSTSLCTWSPWVFAVLCLAHGTLCLWSFFQIPDLGTFCGIMAMFCETSAICVIIFHEVLLRPLSEAEPPDLTKTFSLPK